MAFLLWRPRLWTRQLRFRFEWFATISAPYKRLVWLEDSAHMVMQEQPERFLVHLVNDARPFAVQAGDAAPEDIEQHRAGKHLARSPISGFRRRLAGPVVRVVYPVRQTAMLGSTSGFGDPP